MNKGKVIFFRLLTATVAVVCRQCEGDLSAGYQHVNYRGPGHQALLFKFTHRLHQVGNDALRFRKVCASSNLSIMP